MEHHCLHTIRSITVSVMRFAAESVNSRLLVGLHNSPSTLSREPSMRRMYCWRIRCADAFGGIRTLPSTVTKSQGAPQAEPGSWSAAAAASRPLQGSTITANRSAAAGSNGGSYPVPDTLPAAADTRRWLLCGYAACWLGLVPEEAQPNGEAAQTNGAAQALLLEIDGKATGRVLLASPGCCYTNACKAWLH